MRLGAALLVWWFVTTLPGGVEIRSRDFRSWGECSAARQRAYIRTIPPIGQPTTATVSLCKERR